MKNKPSRNQTQSFGVGTRENYDSSLFYNRKFLEAFSPPSRNIKYVENPVPPAYLDTIIAHSSEFMKELPDNSIHLMITSPPYNVGKDYDSNMNFQEYFELLRRVWKETYRVLVPGGRMCVNIANLGRKPYIPLHAFIIQDILHLGFYMRGEIIWSKNASAGVSTAWGSWKSPTNPVLRDVHEYILVFSKDSFSRSNPQKREATITKEEFLEYTKSVWSFSAVSARKIGHPAPFPLELPLRLIKLYSFKGDVVLDPFMGSGQTALASLQTQRHFIGYETMPEYIMLANNRIQAFLEHASSQ